MAHKLRRRKVDSSTEKRILTGMIVSTPFLQEVCHLVNYDYFKNTYIKKVVRWCIDYYEDYEVAPFDDISSIFQERKIEFKEEDAELAGKLLTDISNKYAVNQRINVPYLVDQTLLFFKKRELEITKDNIGILLDKNDVDGAEDQVTQFTKISKLTSNWVDPLDVKYIEEVFKSEKRMFNFPGALGKFFGQGLERSWLVAVAGAYKRGKCASGTCMVTLADGQIKSLKEVIDQKDKYIISLSEDGKFIKSKISDYYKNGEKPVFRVKTKTGNFVDVTKEHPLLTLDGWKPLSNLDVGDYIAIPKNVPFFGNLSCDEHKIRMLAYMIADGCFMINEFTKYEKVIQKDFKRCVNLFGDSYHTKVDGNSFTFRRGSNINKWFSEIEVDRCKSKYKTLPSFVFKLCKDDLKLFLSVLFSCDGSIYNSKRKSTYIEIEYGSASYKLILQIKYLLLRFGVHANLRYKKSRCGDKYFDSWSLCIRNKEMLLKFINEIGFQFRKYTKSQELLPLIQAKPDNRNLNDLFYGIGNKVLKLIENCDRKSEIFKEKKLVKTAIYRDKGITRNTLKRINKVLQNNWVDQLINSDIMWSRIEDIESLGIQETYDLTVPITHSFIANDVVIHNSMSLQEIVVHAIQQRLRVAFFSLEMGRKESNDRFYKRILGAGEKQGGPALYPVFDCLHNQNGSCKKPERVNSIPLLNGDEKPNFHPNMKYKPCTICRFNSPKDYKVATWYEMINRPAYKAEIVQKHIEAMKKVWNGMYRFKQYPKFSATLDDMKRDLDILEQTEGFIPDIIIVDQANCVRPDFGISLDGTAPHTAVWRGLASMAGERHAMVISPTQIKREALDKRSAKQSDVALHIGLLGDVDAAYVLNQTEEEKREGVMRYNMMIHRHDDFDPNTSCMVLQKIRFGQFYLDGHIISGDKFENVGEYSL